MFLDIPNILQNFVATGLKDQAQLHFPAALVAKVQPHPHSLRTSSIHYAHEIGLRHRNEISRSLYRVWVYWYVAHLDQAKDY
jgi:hypothetical protein